MIKKNYSIFVFFLLFLTSVLCPAQEANGNFWDGVAASAGFGKSFWADMYSTATWVEIAYATNSPDYDWGEFNTNYRFFVFANLGTDLPVWSGCFSDGKYGLSITLPFMIELWYDRFEWKTSPIINTSYRFGIFDTCFIYRLDNPRHVFPYFNIYNWALKFSLLKHESTHIGDELVIYIKDHDFPIKRINVLRNYAEIVFTLNDPDNQPHFNHGFKFGFLFNYNCFINGWYSVSETEADTKLVQSGNFPFELYLQYQYQSKISSHGFQAIASVEYRLRERHKYPFSYSGALEGAYMDNPPNLVNCFNFFAGIRHDNQKKSYFSKIGIGARFYFGLNPYGQYRSMPHYNQIGLVAIFE
ncbi:MAG: hypothetical protein LBV17_09130 [Treponema sp.]|nr:hypothetical protein [Treponema sp.]